MAWPSVATLWRSVMGKKKQDEGKPTATQTPVGHRVRIIGTDIYGTIKSVNDDETALLVAEHDGAPFERALADLELADLPPKAEKPE